MKITANKTVSAEYELFVDGEKDGELELMEKATEQQPLSFIFGVGMMLPKFEENLFGMVAGSTFDFTINNEDAYGQYDDDSVLDLDRTIFEVDGKLDEEMIFEGNVVPLMDNEGNRINAQIVTINDTHVKVDLNHPLAGENLHFKGKVLEVRETTEKELESLSGGCSGCGSNGCGDGGCDEGSCGCDEKEEKTSSCGCGCN
jgi:FKBP-type peptidyl-prolyl cis-trans isomerase SlyD